MEYLDGSVNRMVCGVRGWSGVDWIGKDDGSGGRRC